MLNAIVQKAKGTATTIINVYIWAGAHVADFHLAYILVEDFAEDLHQHWHVSSCTSSVYYFDTI